MLNRQVTMVSLPIPSKWDIRAYIAGREIISGTLIINSVTNNRVSGAINFRGTFIPIHGYWNENKKQINNWNLMDLSPIILACIILPSNYVCLYIICLFLINYKVSINLLVTD